MKIDWIDHVPFEITFISAFKWFFHSYIAAQVSLHSTVALVGFTICITRFNSMTEVKGIDTEFEL